MAILVFLVIGYLFGSLSPGYFSGRIVKGIDIRNFGNKNTGAANTYRIVGPVYGIITGIFDALKAFCVYFIAIQWLNPDTAILVGLAAVAGHIWPFYLRLRGGRGAASLTGLAVIILYNTASWYALAFIVGVIIYGMIFNQVPFEAPVRKILKIGGLIFPLGFFWFDELAVIAVVAVLFIAFIVFDIIRFLAPSFNLKYLKLAAIAKKKEQKFFSGYTLFLVGMIVVLKYFSPELSTFVMTAFIASDILAPAGKEAFLPISFIKEKTIGGAMVIFTVVVIVGIFLRSLGHMPLSLNLVLTGAAVMALLDQLSFIMDDNILVPIGTVMILNFIF